MKTTRLFMLASALALSACTDDSNGNGGKVSVVDWATEMARADHPDTIQDKFDIVIDTDEPAAFNGVIEIAKEQAAAIAAAGD
jgi:hypothetical protein